jgi:thymidylate synthase (FAD)
MKYQDKYNVLDQGEIALIDLMGSDADIVEAARISYGNNNVKKTIDEDRNLIRHLMRNMHTSPFEMAELKFYISMPIFVMRQWIRHRTANVNEYSGRYSKRIYDRW